MLFWFELNITETLLSFLADRGLKEHSTNPFKFFLKFAVFQILALSRDRKLRKYWRQGRPPPDCLLCLVIESFYLLNLHVVYFLGLSPPTLHIVPTQSYNPTAQDIWKRVECRIAAKPIISIFVLIQDMVFWCSITTCIDVSHSYFKNCQQKIFILFFS